MKFDLELDNTLDELAVLFTDSPEKVNKAAERALRKLSRFAERQTLRELSRQQNITQKQLKDLGRVKVSLPLSQGERVLVIWIGVQDIPAHYLGRPVQTKTGVRTGRHQWKGAFLMQPVNSQHNMVFRRTPGWKHKFQRSRRSGRMMWMGLPLEKQSLPLYDAARTTINTLQSVLLERFAVLMQQELNFVFNVEV